MDLELNTGTPVQLQLNFGDQVKRYASRIIGYARPHSIMLQTPSVNGKALLLREGQLVTTRFMGGNSVYAFATPVIAVLLRPFAYLHVEYPTEIEKAFVRESERITSNFPAQAEAPGQVRSDVTIVDISAGGARLVGSPQLGDVGDPLLISVVVEFDQKRQRLSISSIIRNLELIDEAVGMTSYGVQFQVESLTEQLMIGGLIQMYSHQAA